MICCEYFGGGAVALQAAYQIRSARQIILLAHLSEYVHSGEFINKYLTINGAPCDVEDPVGGLYLMGWGMTLGNFKGFVGSEYPFSIA